MIYHSIKEKTFVFSLIATTQKYSYAQGSKVFNKTSSYKLKRFLDENWNEEQLLKDFIKQHKIDWSKGWLIVDDTVIEKPYAQKIECSYWTYSSKNNGFVRGINLTVLLWTDGNLVIPIKSMIYTKDDDGEPHQTKNDFAFEALKYAKSLEIEPEAVLFDSKFSSSNILNLIKNYGWEYFTQLPCSRNFNGRQLKMQQFQPIPRKGNLKGVGHVVCVCKHKGRYYATNSRQEGISREQIVKKYRKRWAVEVLFRELKQCCHLQDCQSLKTSQQRRYVDLCLKAHAQLQEIKNEIGRSIYAAKTWFLSNQMQIKYNGDKLLNGFVA